MRNIDIIDTSSNDVCLSKNVTFVFSFIISDEFAITKYCHYSNEQDKIF